MAQPANGAMYCSAAGSEAEATTTMVCSIAPCCSRMLHDLRDLGALLADGDVDADDALALLVDDRVERDGGLAGLAVADDQLALAAADRDHGVDRLDAGLQRGIDVLAEDHARGDALDGRRLVGLDRALAVDRLAERVDHAADQRVADRHRGDAAGRADLVAFFDVGVLAQDDDADRVLFEVEGEPSDAVLRELDQLARHHVARP